MDQQNVFKNITLSFWTRPKLNDYSKHNSNSNGNNINTDNNVDISKNIANNDNYDNITTTNQNANQSPYLSTQISNNQHETIFDDDHNNLLRRQINTISINLWNSFNTNHHVDHNNPHHKINDPISSNLNNSTVIHSAPDTSNSGNDSFGLLVNLTDETLVKLNEFKQNSQQDFAQNSVIHDAPELTTRAAAAFQQTLFNKISQQSLPSSVKNTNSVAIDKFPPQTSMINDDHQIDNQYSPSASYSHDDRLSIEHNEMVRTFAINNHHQTTDSNAESSTHDSITSFNRNDEDFIDLEWSTWTPNESNGESNNNSNDDDDDWFSLLEQNRNDLFTNYCNNLSSSNSNATSNNPYQSSWTNRTCLLELLNNNNVTTPTTTIMTMMSNNNYQTTIPLNNDHLFSFNQQISEMTTQQQNERVYWALILIILPILALFGNFLVILSVYRERNLQTVTNWFIVSLAFADLFVAIPMLFSTYVMVNVDWELSETVCDLYIATDVICSTASIFNLVAISFDRYIAVTHPIFYSKHKNDKRVIITIILVWMASFGVGLPIMLGANTSPERIPELCIFYNSNFIIYSSLWSFYVPCVMMVILYYKIFKAIHDRARKKMDQSSSGSTTIATRGNMTQTGVGMTTTGVGTLGGVSSCSAITTSIMNANKKSQQFPSNQNLLLIMNQQQQQQNVNKAKNILGIDSTTALQTSTITTNVAKSMADNNDNNKQPLQQSPTNNIQTIKINHISVGGTTTTSSSQLTTTTTLPIISIISSSNTTATNTQTNNQTNSSNLSNCDRPINNNENNPNLNNNNLIETSNSDNIDSRLDDEDEEDDDEDDYDDDDDDDEPDKYTDDNDVENNRKQKKIADSQSKKQSKSNEDNNRRQCKMFLIENTISAMNNNNNNNNNNSNKSNKINGDGLRMNEIDDFEKLVDPSSIVDLKNVNIDNNNKLTVKNNNVHESTTVDEMYDNQRDKNSDSNNDNNNNNDHFKKKSRRFNLGRKHKSSRKKREKVSARRERKATKTLAIVLGVFLLCWTPFFSCNILDAICIKLHENRFIQSDCRPGMTAFLLTTWLGYMNSCANPLIYTIFNTEFRKAFRKILCNS